MASMHQDIEYWDQLQELIEMYYPENMWDKIPREIQLALIPGLRKILRISREYADDGSDPLEYAGIDNSELDQVDWFVDDLEEMNEGETTCVGRSSLS